MDTNVLVSYLLHPDTHSPYAQIVRAGLAGRFTWLIPAEILAELSQAIKGKPYLARHIPDEAVEAFIALLEEVAEPLPTLEISIPAVTRDPDDDYLLAYALVYQADYLVTGDRDLLILDGVEGLRIVTPREFARVSSSLLR